MTAATYFTTRKAFRSGMGRYESMRIIYKNEPASAAGVNLNLMVGVTHVINY